MDLTTVVGFLIAWILVIGGMASGGNLGAYVDFPSLLITIGGTIGAVIISYPGDKLKAVGGVIKSAFISKEPNLLGMVQTIVLASCDATAIALFRRLEMIAATATNHPMITNKLSIR